MNRKMSFLKLIGLLSCLLVGGFSLSSPASATTVTVCSSGVTCDYTTIKAALDATNGDPTIDLIQVIGDGASPYTAVTETTWPLQFQAASTTLQCTGGAVVTQPAATGSNYFYLSTSSTIRDCTFENVHLSTVFEIGAEGQSPHGIRILDNVFSPTVTSTIGFSMSGGTDFIVDGNTNVAAFSLSPQSTTTRGVISNNTFRNRIDYTGGGQIMLQIDASSTEIQIYNNTFTNYISDFGSAINMLNVGGADITFATNTVRYANSITSGSNFAASVNWTASGTRNYIGGNYIESPTSTPSSCTGLAISSAADGGPWSGIIDIYNNTVRIGGLSCPNEITGIAVALTDPSAYATGTLNLYYNLIYNQSTGTSALAGIRIQSRAENNVYIANDYNGAYRFDGVVEQEIGAPPSSDISGPRSKTSDPLLQIKNGTASDDLQTAPFSDYLDVDGTQDIGATLIARRTTITIDDNGTIDYSAVDATSTGDIASFLRSGDTVTLAAGTYSAFDINSSSATSTITIQGVGASTIIDAASASSALTFTNVSSSSITNIRVQNALGASATTYTTTKILGNFGGSDYNEASGPLGLDAGDMALFVSSGSCNGGIAIGVATDGVDITAYTAAGTSDFHLAAVTLFGSKITALLPSSEFANSGALSSYLTGLCELGVGDFTIDAFADNLFTVSGGEYTYDAGSLDSAGINLVAGITDPPTITGVAGSSFAGIKLAGSSNHITISNVTSTSNGYGVWFATSANGYNTVSDSEFSQNTSYDFVSASNATNTLDNVSFTRASSTVTGDGPLLVKFDVRGRAVRAGNSSALSSVTIGATDTSSQATALGATGGTGYTAFVSSLPAYRITASTSDSDVTDGGYNPYTFSASAIAGYNASTTIVNLASANQTVTIAMVSTSPPSDPSGASASAIGVTTSTLSWTDESDDETGFSVNYTNLSTGASATSSADADATSYTITGLTPNELYSTRVLATSTSGGSGYATAANFRTYAAVPDAPTVSALSGTSVSVLLDTNGNSSGTTYALYSSTLGGYLDALGAAGVSPTYQTSSTWGTLTISSLTCATSYSFSAIARNDDLVLTSTSTAAVVSTSACPSSSGGSSSGGGGLSTGSGTAVSTNIPTWPTSSSFIPTPSPTPSPTPTPSPPSPSPSPESPRPEASDRVREVIISNGEAFGLTVDGELLDELASFVEFGTTPETIRLGEGERNSVVRDRMDTMRTALLQSTPATVIRGLEQLTVGEIPAERNLSQERLQLPRALSTFRTIYRHDPIFSNPEENLAWNTLLYRLRFPRDLTRERQGIVEFRRLFRREPRDPFQWATVRVLGYVR